jgi:nucleotide-binding universal stress UspA family protein
MLWKCVVAGVDDSEEGVAAVALGARLAQAMGGACIPVHAVRDFWFAFVDEELDRSAELQAAIIGAARRRVSATLAGQVPEEVSRQLAVRPGRAAAVLRDVAREVAADAVVLGGKHHSLVGRWMGGSTAHDAVRGIGLPVLVAVQPARDRPFQRILVAVDLSEAALPTGTMAREVANTLDAKLRGLCVIEPPLPLPEIMPPLVQQEYSRVAASVLRRRGWPALGDRAETVTREGDVAEMIEREVREWGADLLVVGSHGKGWAERMVLGSVTERLLRDLPTSLLVVPVGVPERVAPPIRKTAGVGT